MFLIRDAIVYCTPFLVTLHNYNFNCIGPTQPASSNMVQSQLGHGSQQDDQLVCGKHRTFDTLHI